MSSWLGVLVRILALLQRKTFIIIETKNRKLKCLKWHYSTVRAMKNVAALTEDGAFALFFLPPPPPWEFAIQSPKNAYAWGSAWGGGGGGEEMGAGGIGWCCTFQVVHVKEFH